MEPVDVGGEVTEFDVSPDGSEIAFVARGEVFVASTEHGTTRRITNTPEQERSVSFSPDGRSLLYASERGGSWKLYRTDLHRQGRAELLQRHGAQGDARCWRATPRTFQPHFSPDGTEVAYLEERTTLKVLNLKTGKTPHDAARRPELLLLRRRPVVRVVARRTLVRGAVPEPHPLVVARSG